MSNRLKFQASMVHGQASNLNTNLTIIEGGNGLVPIIEVNVGAWYGHLSDEKVEELVAGLRGYLFRKNELLSSLK